MMSDAVINPMRVNQQGWIVSFTVGLSRLVAKPKERAGIIKGLDSRYGGAPEIASACCSPEPGNTYKLVAQSGVYNAHAVPRPAAAAADVAAAAGSRASPRCRCSEVTWSRSPSPRGRRCWRSTCRPASSPIARAGGPTATTPLPPRRPRRMSARAAAFGCYYAGTRSSTARPRSLDTQGATKTYVATGRAALARPRGSAGAGVLLAERSRARRRPSCSIRRRLG